MSMCKRFQSFNRTGSGGCKICSFPKNPIFWHNHWNIHTLKHWLFYPLHSFQQTEPYWAMIWEPLRPAVNFCCPRQQGSNISCHGKEGPCDNYTWEFSISMLAFWKWSFLMTHSVFCQLVCLSVDFQKRQEVSISWYYQSTYEKVCIEHKIYLFHIVW